MSNIANNVIFIFIVVTTISIYSIINIIISVDDTASTFSNHSSDHI